MITWFVSTYYLHCIIANCFNLFLSFVTYNNKVLEDETGRARLSVARLKKFPVDYFVTGIIL